MGLKRTVDKDLLESFRLMPCVVCGRTPSDPDHISTRGAGGDDVESNLWPLCRKCHIERHHYGLTRFVYRYNLEQILIDKGFEFHENLRRWMRTGKTNS